MWTETYRSDRNSSLSFKREDGLKLWRTPCGVEWRFKTLDCAFGRCDDTNFRPLDLTPQEAKQWVDLGV